VGGSEKLERGARIRGGNRVGKEGGRDRKKKIEETLLDRRAKTKYKGEKK